jgi:glycosyltransferase involved in cell wall biosynthesis
MPLKETPGAVLLVTPWFTATGGVSKFSQQLHEQLNRAGVETYTWICGERPTAGARFTPGASYVEIPSYVFHDFTLKALFGQIYRAPFTLWRVIRFVRAHNVKTVVLIFPIEYVWPFVILRGLLGYRLILSCHGGEVRSFEKFSVPFRHLFSKTLRTASAITACSEELARELRRLCPQKVDSIRVIPNSVDTKHFTMAKDGIKRSDRPPTLVHVSNFSDAKRVEDIVDAFAAAAIPPVARLVMVGDGPNRELAISKARSLGLESQIDFVGYQKDVRPFLWQADIFIMASEIESDPLALLEAMACGLPWIATPFGAAASMPDNDCGIVVPARCPAKLAAAIGELIDNPERGRSMGLKGRQRAVRDLDANQNTKRYIDLIQDPTAYPTGSNVSTQSNNAPS